MEQNSFIHKSKKNSHHIENNSKKMNFFIKKDSFKTKENNFENYIVSDSHKSSKISNFNDDFNNEVSNDYIQSTSTNNQFNLSNTHYSYKNDLKTDIKNNYSDFIDKNNKLRKSNDSHNNQSFNDLGKAFNTAANLKTDKNIYMTLNPDLNNRQIEKNQAKTINIKTSKKNENNLKREKPDSRKLSLYEKELMNELITPDNLKVIRNSEINSMRDDNHQFRKNQISKNSFELLNHVDSRRANIKGEDILNKRSHNKLVQQVKDLKENKIIQIPHDKKTFNSSFNSQKSSNVSIYKESTNLFSNNLAKNYTESLINNKNIPPLKKNDRLINNSNIPPLNNKIGNKSEKKLYKINCIKIERNELYSDREINQLNLFMGKTIKTNLEVDGQKIDFFFLHKLTNPIRNIEFDEIDKMRYINNLNIVKER